MSGIMGPIGRRTMQILESFESASDAEIIRATSQYIGTVFGGMDISSVDVDEIATPGSESTAIISIQVQDMYDEYVSDAMDNAPEDSSEQDIVDGAVDSMMTDLEKAMDDFAELDDNIVGWDWIEPPAGDEGENLWARVVFDSEGLKPFGMDLESEEEA